MDSKENPQNPIISFFVNLLQSFKLPFPPPPKKNNTKIEPDSVAEPKPIVKESSAENEKKPDIVTFPRQNLAPLKLEAESEVAERNTNPIILWQVYALGGFLILRWAWMRWNESKGDGKKSSNDEPPPAQD